MIVVTTDQFLLRYPKFANKDISDIATALAISHTICSPAELLWGANYILGICLHTAHLLEIDYMQTAEVASMAGAIRSGNQVNLPGSKGETDLQSTVYGQQFSRLRNATIVSTGFSF